MRAGRAGFPGDISIDARTQAQGLSQLHRRAIPYLDDEEIYVGKFARPHRHLSAAEAAGLYMKEADPLGLEVLVPRAIRSDEIMRIRETAENERPALQPSRTVDFQQPRRGPPPKPAPQERTADLVQTYKRLFRARIDLYQIS